MLRSLIAATALALVPTAALAQDDMEETATISGPVEERADQLIPAMRGDLAYADVFDESFRRDVPEEQFTATLGQLEAQFGVLQGLDSIEAASPTAGVVTLRFERALARGNISVTDTPPHFINGLVLNDIQPINDDADTLLGDLMALPGETNLLVTRLGAAEPLISHNADAQMALGSTFKLYVLSALVQAIDAGDLAWDDVVPLSQYSYPSGQLQNWPEGSPVTLHTLATLMISISDNTATDQLIAVLGRDAIEAELVAAGHSNPDATLPFMTTREMFTLKSGDAASIEAYRLMEVDDRRGALEALAGVERSTNDIMAAFTGGPNAIDLEWFASGEDIARLFTRLRDAGDETALGVMAVNPSMSSEAEADWQYVGFKGGSEPGVLNLSWMLQDEAGDWWAVTAGWNNPEESVSLQSLNLIATRAIALANGE